MHQSFLIIILVIFLTNVVYTPLLKAEIIVPIVSKPGTIVALSPAFTPAHLSGLVIYPENNFQFDFLINQGDGNLTSDEKHLEYNKLIKYFLAALTIPDKDQWVNLSPYEKDRMIPDSFGQTRMGNDLLIQDYMLKQLSASLLHPDGAVGKKFWSKVYAQAAEVYGNVHVPIQTFNKVWIVPDKATIYEKGNTVYILENHLKVMLEADYLAYQQTELPDRRVGLSVQAIQKNNLSKEIIRSIILPELEREVNTGKNFALLRQVYSGMLLATWFKRTLKQTLLNKVYANQSKVNGVNGDASSNQMVYEQYLEAFKKGAFNIIQEEGVLNGQSIPRKYFSGGTEGYQNTQIASVASIDAAMSKMINARATKTDVVVAAIKPLKSPSVKEIKKIVGHLPNVVPRLLSRRMLREQGQPVGAFSGKNSDKNTASFEDNGRINREKRIEDNIHFSDHELNLFLRKQKDKALEKIALLKEKVKQGIPVTQLSAASKGLVLAHKYDLVKGHKGLMFEEDYNRLGVSMPWKEFLNVMSQVASTSDKFINFLSGVTPKDAERVFGVEHATYYKVIEPFLPEEKDFQLAQAMRVLVASKLGLVYEAFDEINESVNFVYHKKTFHVRIPAKTHTDQLQRKMYKVLINLEGALKKGRFIAGDTLEVLPDFDVISEAFAEKIFLIMIMEEKAKNLKPILLRNNTINPGQSIYTLKNLYSYVRNNKSLPSYVVTLIKANMDMIEHEFQIKEPDQFAQLLFRFLKYAYDDKGHLRDALKGGYASDNPPYKSELLEANMKITFVPLVPIVEQRIKENVVFTNAEIDPFWKEKEEHLSIISSMITHIESGFEDPTLLNSEKQLILDYKFILEDRKVRIIERRHYNVFKDLYHLPLSWEDFSALLTMSGIGRMAPLNPDAVYLKGIITRKSLQKTMERYEGRGHYLKFMMPYIDDKLERALKPGLSRMIAEHLGLSFVEKEEYYVPEFRDQIKLVKHYIPIPPGVRLEELQRKTKKVLVNLEQALSNTAVKEEVLEVMSGPGFEVVPREFIQRVIEIIKNEEKLGNSKPLVFGINPVKGHGAPMTLRNYYKFTQDRDAIDLRREIFQKNEDSVQVEFVRTVRVVRQYLPIVLSHIFDKNLELKDLLKPGDAKSAPLEKSEIFDEAMVGISGRLKSALLLTVFTMTPPIVAELREFNQVRAWQEEVKIIKDDIDALELKLFEAMKLEGIDNAEDLYDDERKRIELRINQIPYISKAHAISINGEREKLEILLAKVEEKLNNAMMAPGGIDMNQAGLDLQITRDEELSLSMINQDITQFSNLLGFEPNILNIKPAISLSIFSQ